MPKRGLLFATALEANPLLARLGVSRLEGDARFPVYETDRPSITVLISGMGKVNAALGAAHLVQKYAVEEIWNLGLCGALAPGFSPGDLLRIREAREGDRDPTHPGVETLSLPEGIGPSLPAARLVTVDFPVFDAERLRPGNELPGPALVEAPDTTVFVHEGQRLWVDGFLNLRIDLAGAS